MSVVCVCVCLGVCKSEQEKERKKESERERERERERKKERKSVPSDVWVLTVTQMTQFHCNFFQFFFRTLVTNKRE